MADQQVREIAKGEHARLDGIGIAGHMSVPVPGSGQTLPLNQCVRWQLLRNTLGELEQLRRILGEGLIDAD